MTAATDPRPDPAAARMSLVQWLSPAFPTGGFAWSHGLERAISTGEVGSAPALLTWLSDLIEHGSGRTEALLTALALRPAADHAALVALARALSNSAERLAETEAQGAALTRTLNALQGTDHPPAPLPVALGRAAQGLGLPVPEVVGLSLHAFASTLVQAAVRFVPLGQTEGQQVLAALHPAIARTAAWAAGAGEEDFATSGFGAEMAAMGHEGMEVRLFRS
ncbi:urease accessory protein UreF [Frigidibacter sp. MR17.24]|uniref:urease accessory protein UreF n=1 Tax=Frigidibacter sp. MR17.24 TaxID=3127345 RepID=UPI003012A625